MGRASRKSGGSRKEWYRGAHRFEHWYRDRTVYLVTSRVREGKHLFADDGACEIFWGKFLQYANAHGFEPWIASLLSNHYHFVGFLETGRELGEMMRRLHGSVAWLVCKGLDVRHKPFWRDDHHRDYFDGCLRDRNQLVRSYRYVQRQAVRAGLVKDFREHSNTRVYKPLEECLELASARDAYLPEVPYARYEDKNRVRGGRRPEGGLPQLS